MRATTIIALSVLMTLIYSAVAPAKAKNLELSPELKACLNAGATNADWSECTTSELSRQEKRLVEAWKQAADHTKSIGQSTFDALLAEQRLWIKWKDAACLLYREGYGREGAVLHLGICKANVIAERVRFLSTLAEQ